MNIPSLLQKPEFRFLKLIGNTKVPVHEKWRPLAFDDTELLEHIKAGNNYGVLSQHGQLVMIDADAPETLKLMTELPSTFTVRSGKKGSHAYYKCIDAEGQSNKVLKLNGKDVGKILTHVSYVVGPNCVHPDTGKTYDVQLPVEIQTIEWGLIEQTFAGLITNAPIDTKEIITKGVHEGSRNETLFRLACHCREEGLTREDTYAHIWGINKKCTPPLSDSELKTITQHAFNYEKVSNKEIKTDKGILQLLITKNPEDKKEATELITERIIAEGHIKNILTTDGQPEFWVYNQGIYEPYGCAFIEKKCREILGKDHATNIISTVKLKIAADTQTYPNVFFNSENIEYLPVQNGILNFKTLKLEPFTHGKIFFNKLPVNYMPEAQCPKTIKFFNEVLEHGEQDTKLMQEIFGFCLYNEYWIHKAVMLQGSGRNGKGVTLRLLKTLLGVENVSALTLNDFAKNFALDELHRKKANIAGDLTNKQLTETAQFKQVTGGDPITADRKYQSKLNFTSYAKQIFSCNEPPEVLDDTDGFWDRWIVLNYPYHYKLKKDLELLEEAEKEKCRIANPDIDRELAEELPGILNWALEGLKRINTQGGFSTSLSTENTKQFWKRKSNSFWGFVMDCIKIDNEGGGVSCNTLETAYHNYCQENELKKESKYVSILKKQMPTNKAVRKSSGTPYWTSIKVKDYPTMSEEYPEIEVQQTW